MDEPITPRDVLEQVAQAIPEALRGDIIIVGSLATSYQMLRDRAQVIRTKDVDAMVAPYARATVSAAGVAERLQDAGWQPQAMPGYDLPGTADTPDDRLAVVRLQLPGNATWFLELLGAPPTVAPAVNTSGKAMRRLQTQSGHFALPSFAYLGLTQFQPSRSEFGLLVALPEMMALANVLHHPVVGEAVMSQHFAGRSIKRANKDLGRVVAMAYLADLHHEDALDHWKPIWRQALNEWASADADRLLASAPDGLQALLTSPRDIEQALHTVNQGLLTATPLTPEQFVIALRRLLRAIA